MKTMKQIREDLREIRYYYSKQDAFDKAAKLIPESRVLEKATMYNHAIKNAPARLYDLYVSLYINNNSQAALAYEWNFSMDYIKQLNKQLCEFLLKALT